MSKKHKTNPRKQPVSQADVKRAKRQAFDDATRTVCAVVLSVMRDKRGYSVEELQDLWSDIDNVFDSIAQGYVSVSDMLHTLKVEDGIVIDV